MSRFSRRHRIVTLGLSCILIIQAIVCLQLYNHYQRLEVYEQMMEKNLIPVRDFGHLRESLLINRMNLNSLVYLTGKNYDKKFDQLVKNNNEIDSLFDRYLANREVIKDYSHFDSLYNRLSLYKAYEEKIIELLADNRYTTAEKLFNNDSRDIFTSMTSELDHIDRDQANLLAETTQDVRPWMLKSLYLVMAGVIIVTLILILHLRNASGSKNIADS